jgi:hypothetical protein
VAVSTLSNHVIMNIRGLTRRIAMIVYKYH